MCYRVIRTRSIVTGLLIILGLGLGVGAYATEWTRVEGPSVLVRAVIQPYLSITVNSPATFTDNQPVIEFEVDRGPGVYDALHPLIIEVISNQPIKVQMTAEALLRQGGDGEAQLPPQRLSFRLNDPTIQTTREEQDFQPFPSREGDSVKIFETSGPVKTMAEYDFRLQVNPEDRAGTYEGEIFIEVFYQS